MSSSVDLDVFTALHAVPGFTVTHVIIEFLSIVQARPFNRADGAAQAVERCVSELSDEMAALGKSNGANAIIGLTISVSHDSPSKSVVVTMTGAAVRMQPTP